MSNPQSNFFKNVKTEFGGSGLKSHPKTSRPLPSKLPIHLVLKARASQMRLPKNFSAVNEAVRRVGQKYGIRIYEYANCGNHIHLLIRLHKRSQWAAFIRELTGRIGRLMGGKFWAHRPFTRVLRSWGKTFRIVQAYVRRNASAAEDFDQVFGGSTGASRA